MPISKYFHGHGGEVMKNMKSEYGPKKGESVFYATANKEGEKPAKDALRPVDMETRVAVAKHNAGITKSQDKRGRDGDTVREMRNRLFNIDDQTLPVRQVLPAYARYTKSSSETVEQIRHRLFNEKEQDKPLAKDAQLLQPVPVATERTAIKAMPMPMPAGQRNQPSLAPVPVGDATYGGAMNPKGAQLTPGVKVHNSKGAVGEVLAVENEEVKVRLPAGSVVRWPLAKTFRAADARAKDHVPYIVKKVKVPVKYQKEGTRVDIVGKVTAEVEYWAPGNSAGATPGTVAAVTWPRMDAASRELGVQIWNITWPHLSEIPTLRVSAKDADAVKCWECGERFPSDTTTYPFHQDRSGKKCKMSGKKVAQAEDTLTPVPVDDSLQALNYAPKPAPGRPLLSVTEPEDRAKMTGRPAGPMQFAPKRAKDTELKPVPITRVNPAPAAKTVPVSKAKHVKDILLPAESQVKQAEKMLADADEDLAAAIRRREPKVVIDDLKEDVRYAEQALAKRKKLLREYLAKSKDSVEVKAAEADRRDAKVIREESAKGQLSAEEIARKHGFPVPFVKDILSGGKGKDRAKAADSATAAPVDHLNRAIQFEIAGNRAKALDSYRAAAKGFHIANDRANEDAARAGITECQRRLVGSHDATYTHPKAGRAQVCDSAGRAVQVALERTRAGEQVQVVGARVVPGRARDEHEGFAKLTSELSHEKGVTDPKAVAAAIGRKKYGAAGMAAKAAAGRAKDIELRPVPVGA